MNQCTFCERPILDPDATICDYCLSMGDNYQLSMVLNPPSLNQSIKTANRLYATAKILAVLSVILLGVMLFRGNAQ